MKPRKVLLMIEVETNERLSDLRALRWLRFPVEREDRDGVVRIEQVQANAVRPAKPQPKAKLTKAGKAYKAKQRAFNRTEGSTSARKALLYGKWATQPRARKRGKK